MLVVVLALWAVPLELEAHVVKFPRLVHLVFEPSRITVGVGFTQHAGPVAAQLRGRFDLSGDGELDDPEQEALVAWLDERARSHLRLELDETPLRPELVQRTIKLAAGPRSIEGDAIQMSSASVLAIGLRPGAHRVRISDKPSSMRQLVPIRIDLPPDWTISEVLAEGEALPLSRAGERSWQGAFAGEGGTVSFTLTVSPSVRGATEGQPQVGSSEVRP